LAKFVAETTQLGAAQESLAKSVITFAPTFYQVDFSIDSIGILGVVIYVHVKSIDDTLYFYSELPTGS
jgi:hypothetical protein